MHMGLVKRIFGEDAPPRAKQLHKGDYLDLGELAADTAGAAGASAWVRVCEIHRIEDLKEFSSMLFDGNILLLDFRPVSSDEITLRRITNELRRLTSDVNGDIAGIAEHLVIVTPAGMKVDRRKLRAAPTN